jgi:membrane-anchored protein YejM (alkaline phosphatase superfamily)
MRKDLTRWCGWFFTGNVLLYWLMGLKYLHSVGWVNTNYLTAHDKISLIGFLSVSYLGQLAILALLPGLLILLLIALFPRRQFILVVSASIATIGALTLLSDSVLYSIFRYHINGILLNMILHSANEQFFDFSEYEIITMSIATIGFLLLEFTFAYWLWYRLTKRPFLVGVSKWVAVVIGLSIYTSYSVLIYASGSNMGRIYLETVRVLPFYTEFLGAMLPMQNGQIALERAFEKYLVQPDQAVAQMHYPLQPLKFKNPKQHLNVVVIGIDTWRFDMMNAVNTPNIYQFSQQAWVYKRHFSGGNATGPGIFSLFYGLPATYWTSTEVQKRGPVLFDELKKHGYQIKILASGGLTLPPFNRTVFQSIDKLKLKYSGKNPYARDVQATKDLKQFIDQMAKSKQPFFSFIFYDSSHSYCAISNNLKPFTPAVKKCSRLSLNENTNPTPYFNRYKNAVRLVDEQVGQVIANLKAHNMLENTVIVITGDHGEEFNDNHLGYWGHASNFTHFQVQTPLIILWPGQKPKTVTALTTHFDIAPTLMEKVLGCKNNPNDYSLGTSLLNEKPSPYMIVGSYIGFGIVEPSRITTVFPTGGFMVTQSNGQPSPDLKLNTTLMQSVFQEMRRFYQR